MGKEIIVRVPVIPKHTDSQDNLSEIVKFSKKIGVNEVHFLPYHRLGVHKYEKLNREYKLHGIKPISKDDLEATATKLSEEFGIRIIVY